MNEWTMCKTAEKKSKANSLAFTNPNYEQGKIK